MTDKPKRVARPDRPPDKCDNPRSWALLAIQWRDYALSLESRLAVPLPEDVGRLAEELRDRASVSLDVPAMADRLKRAADCLEAVAREREKYLDLEAQLEAARASLKGSALERHILIGHCVEFAECEERFCVEAKAALEGK